MKEKSRGRKSYFSPEGKVALMILKSYTNFSDADLIEHLNGNIHYQLFCGISIHPKSPLTNSKIVSDIRVEIASLLDIDSAQQALADHWRPYLENLHVCMIDATCYETDMRTFSNQEKLTKIQLPRNTRQLLQTVKIIKQNTTI